MGREGRTGMEGTPLSDDGGDDDNIQRGGAQSRRSESVWAP